MKDKEESKLDKAVEYGDVGAKGPDDSSLSLETPKSAFVETPVLEAPKEVVAEVTKTVVTA